jgi:hypothetical protein
VGNNAVSGSPSDETEKFAICLLRPTHAGRSEGKIVGQQLALPFGGGVKFVTPSARAQWISFSLRTDDPAWVKVLQATIAIAAHLETVWAALRDDVPVKLFNHQAPALAGELYRIWGGRHIAPEALSIRSSAVAGSPGDWRA